MNGVNGTATPTWQPTCQAMKRKRGDDSGEVGPHGSESFITGRTFLPIRRDTGVYYTDDWKSSGTAIFCPVKQDMYINMTKHDQISATEGDFFTADEQGNITKSVVGHVLHLWRYDKISRKNFVSQSFLFTSYEDFMQVQAFLQTL